VILAPFDGAADDQFGHAVCVNGENVLIGAPYHTVTLNRQGVGYYYKGLGSAIGTVTETLRLVSSNPAAGDSLGYYASLSGDDALITAPRGGFVGYYEGLDALTTQSANYVAASDSPIRKRCASAPLTTLSAITTACQSASQARMPLSVP
jgi:hypothetical protein